MPTIRLNDAEWIYDESDRLGPPGGFGEVFRGQGATGPVAVKRLKITANEAAHREMGIGKELAARTLQHVIPVLDYGQDAQTESYFLVMPIADRSLSDEIAAKGVLTLEEAKSVALDILAGLQEVGDIVHRDLKPGNVLYSDGRWKLADFGIAKFVERSTSLNTLRGFLTEQYGAPEQWLGEPPTKATDVYALGCIMHTMLNGSPPFTGSQEQVRQLHLHQAAPPLSGDPRLSAFVGQMLRKPAEARPSLGRCLQVISSIAVSGAKPAHPGLLAVASRISQETAEAEAAAGAAAAIQRSREQLVSDAAKELDAIFGRLFDEIESVSDNAKRSKTMIELGRGSLAFASVMPVRPAQQVADPYRRDSQWEVAAYSTALITRRATARRANNVGDIPVVYVGRVSSDQLEYNWGATFFYGKSQFDPTYRWRETSFFSFAGREQKDFPFSVPADDKDFSLAFSNVVGTVNVAYGPLAVDAEDEDDFQHRWLTLFARAASGELKQPDQMPIPDHYLG